MGVLFIHVKSSLVMAGSVGRSIFSTVFLAVKRSKQPAGLCAVSSKTGHMFQSTYQAAVLRELKTPLVLDGQKRKKLQKDEVSTFLYIDMCSFFYFVRERRQILTWYWNCFWTVCMMKCTDDFPCTKFQDPSCID
jgi:hypothetical protein